MVERSLNELQRKGKEVIRVVDALMVKYAELKCTADNKGNLKEIAQVSVTGNEFEQLPDEALMLGTCICHWCSLLPYRLRWSTNYYKSSKNLIIFFWKI